jgi:NAD(P)-dependent dehydrogenase (short-subunit alcohol dehydrogenase family)
MTVQLGGRRVLISGGIRDIGQLISNALAEDQIDAVIWIRGLHKPRDEREVMEKLGLRLASPTLSRTPADRSLWRETMGY